MAIPFEEIPSNILVPLFYVEARPAPSPFSASLKMILIGEKALPTATHTPTAVANTPYILSGDIAGDLFGPGSMLQEMYRIARRNAPFIEIWGIATADVPGAAAATGAIRIDLIPTKALSGHLIFWIGGKRVRTIVRSTDTREQVALRLAQSINQTRGIHVRASINPTITTKVDLTCRWAGGTGNFIRLNYDIIGHNPLAFKMTTITQMSGGIGDPGYLQALAALSGMHFDVFVLPQTQPTSDPLAFDAYMDGTSGRWSPIQQLFGHIVTCTIGTFGELVTFGMARNNPHLTSIGIPDTAIQPSWLWSAVHGALMTKHWAAPPEVSRPLQGIRLIGIQAPPIQADWFDITERQSLLESGVSTWRVDPLSRAVYADRIVTLRKFNSFGDPDLGWRDAVTLFQTQYFIRRLRQSITSNFPRSALTTEDTGIPGFASPGQVKDLIIHEYQAMEDIGLVEHTDIFASILVVERDEVDPNRLNILVRPDLVNQLRIVATLVETNLEFPPDVLAGEIAA